MNYPRIAINYPCFRRSSFFGAIHTAKAVRFLLNLENQTMSDSLKIEFHVKTTTLSRLKIEMHA